MSLCLGVYARDVWCVEASVVVLSLLTTSLSMCVFVLVFVCAVVAHAQGY